MTPTATPIGQTLLQLGLISADQLHIALREQHRSGDALGRQLVRLGFLSEATLRDALAQTLSRESIDLTHVLPDPAALALVPQPVAKRLKLIPLSYDAARQTLVIASAEVDNLVALDQLRSLLEAYQIPARLQAQGLRQGHTAFALLDRVQGRMVLRGIVAPDAFDAGDIHAVSGVYAYDYVFATDELRVRPLALPDGVPASP